ncbi:formate dehydrogenase accessory sulfurtransferase FdhD [Pseudomonas sp.]|uniref:formate dehydrogenase accessory sulfurtransferase FdhD n=1 Tax=Pseudomonas sp. TaxID=306 RepID=UPI00272C4FC9|nr:formate dehydrogenase accessory sulfurtransferase FdhD [Pseudomonas sp.]
MPLRATQSSPSSGAQEYRFASLDELASGCVALPAEAAIALSYNGIAHSVMMATPVDLEDFAVGFSLSNGLIEVAEELYDLTVRGTGERWEAELEVSSRAFWRLKRQRRTLAGTSGCGLCGVEALGQALPDLQPLSPSPLPSAAALAGLRVRIARMQRLGRRSGAVHAALFADNRGDLLLCREDIGRHNALDKLIGALARRVPSAEDGFAVLTSRCSLELVHKVVRAGIGTLVCLSAPSSTSVIWARRHSLNLIHLPRREPPRVYSPEPSMRPPSGGKMDASDALSN